MLQESSVAGAAHQGLMRRSFVSALVGRVYASRLCRVFRFRRWFKFKPPHRCAEYQRDRLIHKSVMTAVTHDAGLAGRIGFVAFSGCRAQIAGCKVSASLRTMRVHGHVDEREWVAPVQFAPEQC